MAAGFSISCLLFGYLIRFFLISRESVNKVNFEAARRLKSPYFVVDVLW